MCGLAGFLDHSGLSTGEARQRVGSMTDTLTHRGPDAGGSWVDGPVALGHRRLSILDLSASGAQPMHSADGRFVIVFNGEIYNHLDLRQELEASGLAPAWRGHSDTETLLAAIGPWGVAEALKRCSGMFAFALWDRREDCLVLARDRIGEKPLYWGWAGDALVFGSELKALRAHPAASAEICRGALAQYLRFGYVPSPRSIYKGIYKLEPGSVLVVDGSAPVSPPATPIRPGERYENISLERYWSLNAEIETGASHRIVDEGAAIDELERLIGEAAERQMISDVPLGAFLSGGVDSSTVVALMQSRSAHPVKTFTIGFDVPDFDESAHAAAVANHLGTDHHELRVSEADAQAVIPNLPFLYDEPFADSSQIPTHFVCRAAREHVTVALSGDAGDELFGGYNRYVWGPGIWERASAVPKPIRTTLARAASSMPIKLWDDVGTAYRRAAGRKGDVLQFGGKAHRVASSLCDAGTIDDFYGNIVSQWMAPLDLVPGLTDEPKGPLGDELPDAGADDPAARMMLQDMRSYLPDDILCKVDRAAMGISLETRVPFLDPNILRFSARLPARMKVRAGSSKWILRQVLYRHVPKDLIERPKAGFAMPMGLWLRGPLREWADSLLAPEKLARDDLLDPGPIRRIWQDHLSGRRDASAKIWVILMLQAWREAWT
ncbi:asparagine synthase (glutamine-hydrolyzing) [Amorphus sp. 3PC139-8]|uniref:asparagine synthase (glutamine-hydrolyzing) n=1 Tax=Amorphus sp. 3PC139-8 TaxID=2735676 RepID=UPI00345D59B8